MILSDRVIKARYEEFFPEGYDQPRVNPASIDLTIGPYIMREPLGLHGDWVPESLFDKHTYQMRPHEVLLVSTAESIYIPPDLAGEVRLKSSRAREGFNMGNAGYVDPGWNGVLTFQITNSCNNKHLTLKYQQPFFQLILHLLNEPAERPYAGRYQDAKRVEGSR